MSDYENRDRDIALEDLISPSPSPPASSSPVISEELASVPPVPPPPCIPSHRHRDERDLAPFGGGRLRAAAQAGHTEGFSPTTALAFKKVLATLKATMGEGEDSGIGNGSAASHGASLELASRSGPPSLTQSTLGSSVEDSPVLPGQDDPNYDIPAGEVGLNFYGILKIFGIIFGVVIHIFLFI